MFLDNLLKKKGFIVLFLLKMKKYCYNKILSFIELKAKFY